MSLEKVRLESQFFEAPVYSDGKIMGVAEDAIIYSMQLRERYVINAQLGTGFTYSVNLRPQFKDQAQQGWLVEAVEIIKPKVSFTHLRQELLN